MLKRIHCIEIPVSDMQKAAAFYENTLHLIKTYEHPVWTSFDVGGTSFALAVSGTKGSKGDAGICKSCSPCVFRYSAAKLTQRRAAPTATAVIYLAVEDLDAVYGELREKGVEFIAGPKEQAWGGRTAVMLDPDKNMLVLAQYE